MRILSIAASLLLAGPALAADSATAPPDTAALVRDAAQASGELSTRLKSELVAAMQSGGPEAAIATCHTRALPLTSDVSAQKGWSLRRTALRVRNPANAPRGWEQAVLEVFAQRIASGEDPARVEWHAVATENGKREFRYMKAIVTSEPCVLCHGTQVAAPLSARIRSLYPDDRATGFVPGELRGAFSLTKALD